MTYDSNFYDRNYKFQKALADVLTPWIKENLNPESVIDFGCGCGYFLQSIVDASDDMDKYYGLNFNHPENLFIHESRFIKKDFTHISPAFTEWYHKTFDLVISLEVAEHLPPSSADNFIETLVDAAKDYILFSAATPGQGGEDHSNEQPHEYWHHKFASKGFIAHDVIRPVLMFHTTVPFWYRQNIFLYKKV